ncbi:MAG: (Fe-S)-binding protein, partial [Planctomycetes bacterium]|nr:(Fe-S)-binding protein [Planctomycetota bacterium]
MPKKSVSLDVTQLDNFVYDMTRCVKCRGCTWVDHIYMSSLKFGKRCPSAAKFLFDSHGAYGKMRIGIALLEGRLEYSEKLLEVLYACTLCGACDVGCKRNLDLEIELTLEALRIKAVQDGQGPMPAHKRAAKNIAASHNPYGAPHMNRNQWLPKGVTASPKA